MRNQCIRLLVCEIPDFCWISSAVVVVWSFTNRTVDSFIACADLLRAHPSGGEPYLEGEEVTECARFQDKNFMSSHNNLPVFISRRPGQQLALILASFKEFI